MTEFRVKDKVRQKDSQRVTGVVLGVDGDRVWVKTNQHDSPLTYNADIWELRPVEWEVGKTYTTTGLRYPIHCVSVHEGNAHVYWVSPNAGKRYHSQSPESRASYTEVDD